MCPTTEQQGGRAFFQALGAWVSGMDCGPAGSPWLLALTLLSVHVSSEAEGQPQTVVVSTAKPGSLLLHWGVEGGAGYKGGWRLPGPSARPPATVQYKQRALQTRFQPGPGGEQSVRIVLEGEEASDRLNFVVKDEGTGAWYNLNGSNFQELCGIWAYLAWERAGCPSRSEAEADAEYASGVEDLVLFLRQGVTLDELWAVARGKLSWDQFTATRGDRGGGKSGAGGESSAVADAPAPVKEKKAGKGGADASPPAPPPSVPLPEHLVATQAYLLWEEAGRPDGADFSDAARRRLEEQVAGGETVPDLEKALQAKPAPPPPAAAPAAPAAGAALGRARGMRAINPLDLINKPGAAPLLTDARTTPGDAPLAPLVQDAAADEMVRWYRVYNMGDGAQLLASVRALDADEAGSGTGPSDLVLELTSDSGTPLVLHWGVHPSAGGADTGSDWSAPAPSLVDSAGGQLLAGGGAAENAFSGGVEQGSVSSMDGEDLPLQRCLLPVPASQGLAALSFVLRSQDGSRWWRDGGGNFRVPLPHEGGGGEEAGAVGGAAGEALRDPVARAIIDAEATPAWTLMHRFNRASELLDALCEGRFEDVEGGLARIYVWLRYSAIRQLTWQRNYNTQPRILGAAQERLTHTIARVYSRTSGQAREWARLLLTTVGRGGNAQAVRDEILNIMHRHHIPEKHGTWMEQWHQKLHNNTTPDDVPICEAYIAFLKSRGDHGTYWAVLADAGVSRQRLESFDRPVTVEPDYPGGLRDALIHDFGAYLKVLKAVHSGADLQASASAAAAFVPGPAKAPLGYALSHGLDAGVLALVEAAVEARTELAAAGALAHGREPLYLDLALEGLVRSAAERGSSGGGAPLIGPLLQNLALSVADNAEVCHCLAAWLALPAGTRAGARPSRDEALRAMAVVDRTRRALGALSDATLRVLSPLATGLGATFGAEPWAVQLFGEEVVRSGPAFALSLALSVAEPGLRAAAELGAWQLVSPGAGTGRVVVVPALHVVQDEEYKVPTVLLAHRVTGEEEIPSGVVALLSPDAPDVLSHLAVRARNLHVLFAACHDAAPLDELEAAAGRVVEVESTAAGGITWREVAADEAGGAGGTGPKAQTRKPLTAPAIPKWCGKWVVGMDAYAPGVVGAKSKNLAGLRGRLPASIALPASVTIPFGSCEKALEAKENRGLAKQLRAAVSSLAPHAPGPALARCRDLVNQMTVPAELKKQLGEAMVTAGIPVPENEARWDAALTALKAVWASKYNDRAFYSCRKVGLGFDEVRMAVLCQRVVPARYAFVIHTANPVSGDAGEVYAELVLGLGESIVSGMVPGTALAFAARKDALEAPRVLLYPSKSLAMRVPESIIFRSDSNGEDLEGYAGAGLYESVTLDASYLETVDYSADALLADDAFRTRLMSDVCRVGLDIETALGSAQDVEGVVGPDGTIHIVQTRPQV